MTNRTEGAKYNSNLRKVEIAALVRAEIKAAIKAGTIPAGTKVSVTCSDGNAIYAKVTAFAGNVEDPTWVLFRAAGGDPYHTAAFGHQGGTGRYAPEFARVVNTIEAMLEAYNFDNSDLQTDYFHVNFYTSTGACWKLEKAQREAVIAANSDFLADLAVELIAWNDSAQRPDATRRADHIANKCAAETFCAPRQDAA